MNGSRSVSLMFNVVVYFCCSSVALRFSPKMNYRRMCVRLDLVARSHSCWCCQSSVLPEVVLPLLLLLFSNSLINPISCSLLRRSILWFFWFTLGCVVSLLVYPLNEPLLIPLRFGFFFIHSRRQISMWFSQHTNSSLFLLFLSYGSIDDTEKSHEFAQMTQFSVGHTII